MTSVKNDVRPAVSPFSLRQGGLVRDRVTGENMIYVTHIATESLNISEESEYKGRTIPVLAVLLKEVPYSNGGDSPKSTITIKIDQQQYEVVFHKVNVKHLTPGFTKLPFPLWNTGDIQYRDTKKPHVGEEKLKELHKAIGYKSGGAKENLIENILAEKSDDQFFLVGEAKFPALRFWLLQMACCVEMLIGV